MPSANDYAPTVPNWCAVLAVLRDAAQPLTLGAIGAEVGRRRRAHDVWRSRVAEVVARLERDGAVSTVRVQHSPRRWLKAYELTKAGRALLDEAVAEARALLVLDDESTSTHA